MAEEKDIQDKPQPGGRKLVAPWVKKAIPITVSLLILYYYFYDQDWGKLADSTRNANLTLAILAIFIPQLVFWFLHTLFVQRTLKWFHGPIPFWTFFWIRGSIYILQFVNTVLGGGGLLLYQQRKAHVSWRKLLGIELFRFGMSMWGITLVLIPATYALYYYGLADKVRINMWVWWWFLLVPGLLFFLSTWNFWFNGRDPLAFGKLIVRDRESEFWTAFYMATRRQWLWSLTILLPPFLLTMLGLYVLSLSFNLKIHFLEFMVLAPLMTLVMDLPVGFAGIGLATLSWKTFFGDSGSPDSVAALTLFLPFARLACRGIIGLVSLPPALKDIGGLFQAANGAPAEGESAAEEAAAD